MKRTLLLLALLVGFTGFSQKIIKKEKVLMNYTQFPSDYSLINFKKYFYSFDGFINHRADIEKRIVIPNLERAYKEENADFSLIITQLEFLASDRKAQKKVSNTKNKDGSITKTTKYYFTSTTKAIFRIDVLSKRGELLSTIEKSYDRIFKTRMHTKYESALQDFNDNFPDFKKGTLLIAFQNAFDTFKEKYFYVDKAIKTTFVGFKYKKHDYSELNEAAIANNAFLKSNLSDEGKAKLLEYIALCQKELKNFDGSNKKARINTEVKAGLLYNIALAQFRLGDFENSYKNMKEAFEINRKVHFSQRSLYAAAEKNFNNARK